MRIENDNFVALSLFTSGYCNAECKYCYISKNEELKDLHKKIVKYLENDNFIKDIEILYGKKLKNLSFWGTEPSLTLNIIKNKIKLLKENFTNLSDINLSSNFLLDNVYFIFYDFIKECNLYNINLSIQISIDGPPEITNENRHKNAVFIIKNNFLNLIKLLQNVELKNKITFSFKSTLNINNLNWINEEESRLKYYFYFFEDFIDEIVKLNKNKNVVLNLSGLPSLVVPGQYTKDDGKIWGKTCNLLYLLNKENNFKYHKKTLNTYVLRLMNFYNNKKYIYLDPTRLNCSAGRNNLQIDVDSNLHLCHRSLFLKTDKCTFIDDKGNNLHLNDKIDLILERQIANFNNEYEVNRLIYNWYITQSNFNLKYNILKALIYECLYSNQISEIYNNNLYNNFLIYFLMFSMGCIMDNILTTGSLYIPSFSLIRMFGNGAFEIILKEFFEKIKGESK